MKRIVFASASITILLAAAGMSQAPPSVTLLVNRMSGAYRSLQTFSDKATITRKVLKKDAPATLTLAMQKPNKYLIELKGEYLNTIIVSDGNTLTALRPDKNLYTKTKAPSQIIRADLIGEVDMPSPGARIISQLLAGNSREGAVGQLLLSGKVSGPEKVGKTKAYVLTIPFGEEAQARLYIGVDDYLIRQVKLVRGEEVEWLEEHTTVELDKPVAPEMFSPTLPEGAKQVASLPPLEKPVEVASKDETTAPATGEPAKSSRTPQIAEGRSVFQGNGCTGCHVLGGAGGRMGPNLSRIGATRARERLIQYVRNPRGLNRNARMPGFGDRIGNDDLQALGDYLASLK